MARDLFTLAFVDGKGWVPPEATPEQEAERVAAYEAVATLLKSCKDRKRRKDLQADLKKAHVVCAQVCMVEVNVGSIRSIDEGARNTRVNINTDGLSIPVHGYVDMTNFPVWDALAKVRTSFGRCRYRIIVRRTPDIHPSVPWGEVEAQPVEGEDVKVVRIRDLVMISPLEVSGGTAAAPDAASPAAPEPSASATVAATTTAAAAAATATTLFPQFPDSAPVCPFCGEPSRGPRPVLKHTPTGRFAHKVCIEALLTGGGTLVGPTAEPAPVEPAAEVPPPEAARHPRVAESKPWDRTNTDGSINLGSFAIQASLSMVELAVELLSTHLADVGEPGPPAPAAVAALAGLLLAAADRTQQAVRADHHFDRSDNSHTRARGAVRIALKLFPVPFRGAEESPADVGHRREHWVASLADYASMLIQTAVSLDQ